jgi:hypothetical protein
MSEALWKLPIPATAIFRGPFFRELPGRQYEITFTVEGDHGEETPIALAFYGVEAFKCTYMKALGSIDRQLRKDAYGALIEITGSSWLGEVGDSYKRWYATTKAEPQQLHHVMIMFDDGPCFEFICVSFELPQWPISAPLSD